MSRAYLSLSAAEVGSSSDNELFGQLASKLPFAVEPAQRAAWQFQIGHLRQLASEMPSAHFFLEFLIPRMGRRADLIVVQHGVAFVIEYKLGAQQFDRASLDQVYGYGLDLKHFHETSHDVPIVPVLVATATSAVGRVPIRWDEDQIARPIRSTADQLASVINEVCSEHEVAPLVARDWAEGRYRPHRLSLKRLRPSIAVMPLTRSQGQKLGLKT